MKLAHDSPLSRHLGVKKMTDKLCMSFYWPGVSGDVQRYCRSCDICQRTVSKGRVAKVSLVEMPLIDTPFKRIAVDLVGPIHPITERGNRYILVIVDYATRYPEAVALPHIESERVAEALLEVYSRLGIPQEHICQAFRIKWNCPDFSLYRPHKIEKFRFLTKLFFLF